MNPTFLRREAADNPLIPAPTTMTCLKQVTVPVPFPVPFTVPVTFPAPVPFEFENFLIPFLNVSNNKSSRSFLSLQILGSGGFDELEMPEIVLDPLPEAVLEMPELVLATLETVLEPLTKIVLETAEIVLGVAETVLETLLETVLEL